MSLDAKYRVPLVAEVEIEAGEVVAVHLPDEAIEGPFTVTDDGGELPPEERRAALHIAKAATWPGRRAGW